MASQGTTAEGGALSGTCPTDAVPRAPQRRLSAGAIRDNPLFEHLSVAQSTQTGAEPAAAQQAEVEGTRGLLYDASGRRSYTRLFRR